MPEMQNMFIRHRKYLIYLMVIYIACWGFTEYKTVFAGLLLGTAVSMFNLRLIIRKMHAFDDAIEKGNKVKSMGTGMRMAAAIVAAYISMRFPDVFHLVSVVIGLMTAYAVIMIDYFVQNVILHK
ncbi:ATP synthase subunit I [Peribacillus loiseleuriae]|uniref:ATP synthase subunit I n=1 Tax=Peribacillus loiseleuriae TaxID=1679170 RepID=UPI003D012D1A